MLRILIVLVLSACALSAHGAQVRSVPLAAADNEPITAASNETVEVIFADGTSILLSAGASVLIDRYRYDHSSRTGELRLHVQSGAVRVLGGALNNSSAIVVGVPGASASLDNAVAYVHVSGEQSELALVAGRGMTVQGAKESRSLNKSGAALAVKGSGDFAGKVRKLGRADVARYASVMNPGLTTGVAPRFVVDRRPSEDQTAKDVKLIPALPDPVAPAGCTASACTAGAPNFDLGSSVGSVSNRQLGRTFGATWKTAYTQGTPLAAQSAANAPPADFTPATDGFRNTTARIFAASPATPYALTIDPAAPPFSIATTDEMPCLAGDGGACHSSPITNLYSGTTGARYGYISTFDDFSSTLMLALEDSGFSSVFGSFRILAEPLVDLNQQGTLLKRGGLDTVSSCVDSNNFGGACTYAYASPEERDAAKVDQEFLKGPIPGSSSLPLQVFSDYAPEFIESFDAGPVAAPYLLEITFHGTSATDTLTLQTGFRPVTLTNSESSLNTYCTWGTAACTEFAFALFGVGNDLEILHDLTEVNPAPIAERTATVVARADDSFLGIEALSRLPNDNQRMFYATGSVSGRLQGGATAQGASLDTFTLSPGLDPAETIGRAFLRPETLLNIAPTALVSTGLRVLNAPYSTAIASSSRTIQYDFAAAGTGVDQTSTISVTLADLTYDTATKGAQLSGRTVGSTQRSGTTRYSGSVQSPLFSTAIGGGNPNLANTGRVGYLALENYDPVSSPTGGLERTIESGTASQTHYAQLRFGQILAGGTAAAPSNRPNLELAGYVGGLVELAEAGSASGAEVRSLFSNGFALVADAAQGTAGAAIDAAIGSDAATLRFGSRAPGNAGLSAYVGDKDYAAMTGAAPPLAAGAIADSTAPNAALISGAPLIGVTSAQGWTLPGVDDATRAKLSAGAAGYRHLQWGFLFGDIPTAGGRTAHAHLTSWVAGRPTPEGTPLPTGTADYAGHVFANISNGQQLYSSVGAFANHWDFATRSGTGTMSLDGQSYGLNTRLMGLQRVGTEVTSSSTTRFEGLISAAGESSYVGGLNGSFVADPAATNDPSLLRSAIMGQFSLSRTLGGNPYHAAGTFGGERTTP